MLSLSREDKSILLSIFTSILVLLLYILLPYDLQTNPNVRVPFQILLILVCLYLLLKQSHSMVES